MQSLTVLRNRLEYTIQHQFRFPSADAGKLNDELLCPEPPYQVRASHTRIAVLREIPQYSIANLVTKLSLIELK